jgi:uncharacterized lipoprotein YmbA
MLLLVSACGWGGKRLETNYYVLDYQPSTERAELIMSKSNGKNLNVFNTTVNRTYNRNQLVEKESFYKVNFSNNELWANRLTDAVPNIIARRLSAYNIFGNVSRAISETDPDFYLETTLLNIEKVMGEKPKAFLRMEFVLRDSTGNNTVLVHRNERTQNLYDDSYLSLVQSFNNMIMEETNLFAAKCIEHFSGRTLSRIRPEFVENMSAPAKIWYEDIADQEAHLVYGELLLPTKFRTTNSITYKVERLDSLNTKINEYIGEYNTPMILLPGKYRVITGHNEDIVEVMDVHPRQRPVIDPVWSELVVRIMDSSQNRVRQLYRIWLEDEDEGGYLNIGQEVSLGDDEHGIEDKIWILPKGKYMLTLGGSSWSDLRDFATICLNEGDSQVLTVIVNTDLTAGNIMVGAGVLSDALGFDADRFHRGAVHINVNITSKNKEDEKDPTYSLILSSKLDNTIDHDFGAFHYNMRSVYDLSSIFSKDIDLRFDRDDYSLKNTLLLYPWKRDRKVLGKFALYSRADLNTHFMDEYTYFSSPKNYILLDVDGIEKERAMDQEKMRIKVALYPMRLKEGAGLTYRFALSPTTALTLRGGYGWQQDVNRLFYSSTDPDTIDGVIYDVYRENRDKNSNGLESTLIFSAGNILNFMSVNSIFEALFPFDSSETKPRFENENTFNFRIYRNISMDVELKLSYNESERDWLVYDLSSFLRLSLFY